MPQAPEELRRKWWPDDPDAGGEEKACQHLESRGYKLTTEWNWLVPQGMSPNAEDISAANYLVLEWDWGGFCWTQEQRDATS